MRKPKVSMCMLMSQIKCLNVLLWNKYMLGDVCATHLLHRCLHIVSSHAPDIASANTLLQFIIIITNVMIIVTLSQKMLQGYCNQHHELQSSRATAAFLHKYCSQLCSDLDCWKLQVWWIERGCLPCLKAAQCAGTLSCWKIKNSPEISHVTVAAQFDLSYSSCSVNQSINEVTDAAARHSSMCQ